MTNKEKKDKKEPSWIKRANKKQVITFKDKNTNIVKFLDEGIEQEKEITVKETGEKKKIYPVTFDVVDLNDSEKLEKDWDVSSSRLLKELAKHFPLIDKEFEITRIGSSFNTTYKVRPLQ